MIENPNTSESKQPEPETDLFGMPVPAAKPADTPPTSQELGVQYVAPHECSVWPQNPRQPDRLNEENTRELRESIVCNGQAIAAIVRHNATGAPKYEIIAGSRRWWCIRWLRENGHPDLLLKIEIRSLDDEAAFRLTSLENNDRLGVSAYETGLSLRGPLRDYYGGRQVAMAKALGKTEAWVSRHLTLAEIPPLVANSYVDWSEIRLKHGPKLAKKRREDIKGLLGAAEKLTGIQNQRLSEGKQRVSSQECFTFLLQNSTYGPEKPKPKLPILGPKHRPHASVVKVSAKKMLIEVNLASGAKSEQVGSFVQKYFDKHREQTPGSPQKVPRSTKP